MLIRVDHLDRIDLTKPGDRVRHNRSRPEESGQAHISRPKRVPTSKHRRRLSFFVGKMSQSRAVNGYGYPNISRRFSNVWKIGRACDALDMYKGGGAIKWRVERWMIWVWRRFGA